MMAEFKAIPAFAEQIERPMRASRVEVLQINVGYQCNLECKHCHVKAGPGRHEVMSKEIMEQCLEAVKKHGIPVIDVTGGSPEMHPHLAWFLEECAALGRRILVRSNGVLLLERQYEEFIKLYARLGIEVVLSLPHVDPRTTDRQRGNGVFVKVIQAMNRLNTVGYGRSSRGLVLDLVHNPAGAYLPGPQKALELNYRNVLGERYGVVFSHLFCINNMPIGRFRDYLIESDNYDDYMKSLIGAYNPTSLEGAMCRSMVSVGPDGTLYDCDFNQMMSLVVNHGAPRHISAFNLDELANREISVGDHCYGCTAGAGSSCKGQMA